jgi:hypothetical protein
MQTAGKATLNQNLKYMRKIILVCGLIAGLISSAWCLYSQNYMDVSVSLNTRTVLGYAAMVLAFSVIFVGVKNYRDKHNNGVISFGTAFKIAMLITLVASTIYMLAWMIDYYFVMKDFGGKYMALMRSQMLADGKSATEIQKEMTNMNKYIGWYKSPLFNVIISYTAILPPGILISLIASFILKNNSKRAKAS